jgi:hypothetical protein
MYKNPDSIDKMTAYVRGRMRWFQYVFTDSKTSEASKKLLESAPIMWMIEGIPQTYVLHYFQDTIPEIEDFRNFPVDYTVVPRCDPDIASAIRFAVEVHYFSTARISDAASIWSVPVKNIHDFAAIEYIEKNIFSGVSIYDKFVNYRYEYDKMFSEITGVIIYKIITTISELLNTNANCLWSEVLKTNEKEITEIVNSFYIGRMNADHITQDGPAKLQSIVMNGFKEHLPETFTLFNMCELMFPGSTVGQKNIIEFPTAPGELKLTDVHIEAAKYAELVRNKAQSQKHGCITTDITIGLVAAVVLAGGGTRYGASSYIKSFTMSLQSRIGDVIDVPTIIGCLFSRETMQIISNVARNTFMNSVQPNTIRWIEILLSVHETVNQDIIGSMEKTNMQSVDGTQPWEINTHFGVKVFLYSASRAALAWCTITPLMDLLAHCDKAYLGGLFQDAHVPSIHASFGICMGVLLLYNASDNVSISFSGQDIHKEQSLYIDSVSNQVLVVGICTTILRKLASSLTAPRHEENNPTTGPVAVAPPDANIFASVLARGIGIYAYGLPSIAGLCVTCLGVGGVAWVLVGYLRQAVSYLWISVDDAASQGANSIEYGLETFFTGALAPVEFVNNGMHNTADFFWPSVPVFHQKADSIFRNTESSDIMIELVRIGTMGIMFSSAKRCLRNLSSIQYPNLLTSTDRRSDVMTTLGNIFKSAGFVIMPLLKMELLSTFGMRLLADDANLVSVTNIPFLLFILTLYISIFDSHI